MDIKSAARLIRKKLLIGDEPLKAYNLLKALNIKDLEPELKKTYGSIIHMFEPDKYEKIYKDDSCLDYDIIEPEEHCLRADEMYGRFKWIFKNVKEAKSLIDLGCYVGSLVLTAGKKYKISSVGVDLTQKAINIAKKRAKKFEVSNVEFFQGNAVTYKSERKFDAVVAFEILEHVPDPVVFVKNLLGLVSDDGFVYMSTPNGAFIKGWGNCGQWEWDGKGTRGHVRAFVPETVRELISEADGVIEELVEAESGILWIKFKKK